MLGVDRWCLEGSIQQTLGRLCPIGVLAHFHLNYPTLAPQEVQEGRPLDPSLPASGWVPNLGVLMALGHGPSQVGSLHSPSTLRTDR